MKKENDLNSEKISDEKVRLIKKTNDVSDLLSSVEIQMVKSKNKRDDWLMLFSSLLSLALFLVFLRLSPSNENRTEKDPLKNRISTMIKNGAPLESIKHAYDVRDLKPTPLRRGDASLYYSETTPLSIILNDLCVDYFSTDLTDKDSLYYSRLSSIIQENQYHNPFDMLEIIQSRYFENLRYKIGDEYDVIQDDVTQIATELYNKNLLVTKYLNKSNTSFTISIIALIVTFLMSCIQIIQSRKTNSYLRPLFKEVDKESDEKPAE